MDSAELDKILSDLWSNNIFNPLNKQWRAKLNIMASNTAKCKRRVREGATV